MRKLLLAVLVILPFAADIVHAQANAELVICDVCRDPERYPDDYVNFGFNQVFGRDGWMNPDQADDFFIENAEGQRVYVDIDFVMRGISVFGTELPFWPRNMVHITVALPSGLVYEAIRSVFLRPLPVPTTTHHLDQQAEPEPADEGGNDGVDDFEGEHEEDPDEDEPEWDYVGTTGIEDPDENGDFMDDEWCEEC